MMNDTYVKPSFEFFEISPDTDVITTSGVPTVPGGDNPELPDDEWDS